MPVLPKRHRACNSRLERACEALDVASLPEDEDHQSSRQPDHWWAPFLLPYQAASMLMPKANNTAGRTYDQEHLSAFG